MLLIWLVTSICQKSKLVVKFLAGSKTNPIVKLVAFSGLRAVLPPFKTWNCDSQLAPEEAPAITLPPGQLIGLLKLPAVLVYDCEP
jgi:hypothetical protein